MVQSYHLIFNTNYAADLPLLKCHQQIYYLLETHLGSLPTMKTAQVHEVFSRCTHILILQSQYLYLDNEMI